MFFFCRSFGSRLHLFQLLHLLIYDRTKCKEVFLTLLPSFLATKAFWLTVASLGTCDLADVSYDGGTAEGNLVPDSVSVTIIRSFGLFRYSESSSSESSSNSWQNSTTYYSESINEKNETKLESIVDNVMERIHSCHKMDRHFFILDGNFRTARVAGAIALTLGFFVVIITWVQTCKPISKSLWKITMFSVLLCTLMEGLTLLIFHASFCSGEINDEFIFVADGTVFEIDNINCKIASGSGATIAACTFWFIAAVTIFVLVPHDDVPTTSIHYNNANATSSNRFDQLDYADDGFSMGEYDSKKSEGSEKLYSDELLTSTVS